MYVSDVADAGLNIVAICLRKLLHDLDNDIRGITAPRIAPVCKRFVNPGF